MNRNKPLNAKQAEFCKLYAESGSAMQSYMKAYDTQNTGSAATMATRLLEKPHIQRRISEIQQYASELAGVDCAFVLEGFVDMFEKWKDKDPTAAIRALENIGKHVGFYREDNIQRQANVSAIQLVVIGEDEAPKRADADIEADYEAVE